MTDRLEQLLNTFTEVRECDYKGEHYSVRDNGAIMRHPKTTRVRPKDNIWTFGDPNDKGYCAFCGEVVHRVVAFAFLGKPENDQMVVDHIDTNRQNNRPKNLRWLTKLENALNNPVTRKRIEYLCGGNIQKFIDNPSCLRDLTGTNQDLMWMRTVSAEEAKACYDKVMSWALRPSSETLAHGGKMGEWIYESQWSQKELDDVWGKPLEYDGGNKMEDGWGEPIDPTKMDATFWGEEFLKEYSKKEEKQEIEEADENEIAYYKTSNDIAVQTGWSPHTNPEFPCCPKEVSNQPLHDYLRNLKDGKVFVTANYGESTVFEFTLYQDKILVITKIPNGIKHFALTTIEWNGEVFVHTSKGTFSEENGVRAAYTRAQDKEWDGPDSIDNYC